MGAVGALALATIYVYAQSFGVMAKYRKDFAPYRARLIAGVEALTGLLMIGWSASFTYLEMERFWRHG